MPARTYLVPKEDERKLALTLINGFHFLYFLSGHCDSGKRGGTNFVSFDFNQFQFENVAVIDKCTNSAFFEWMGRVFW
jgi:hypothetical protein